MTRLLMTFRAMKLPTTPQVSLSLGLERTEPGRSRVVAVAVSLSVLIFLLDLVFPRGIAAGVPYVAVVLLGLWIPDRHTRLLLAAGVSLLTVIGFFIPFPVQHLDGLSFWIGLENRMIALCSIGITMMLVDLAVQRNGAIREREGKLRAVLDAAVDAVVILDEQGRVETCNPAARELFQYNAESIVGMPLERLVILPAETITAAEGGFDIRRLQREAQAVREDGRTFPVELSFSKVTVHDRQLYAGILRDITERKRTERRLVQTESLAAIGEAITGLAHESRNALQRTQACIELLDDRVADDTEAVSLVRDIQQAQDELYYLYEKVRNYASPRPLDAHSCTPAALMSEVWQQLETEYASREVSLTCSGAGRGMVVEADSYAIKQLFRNLLENALGACEDPVAICGEFRDVLRQGEHWLEITLSDNGPGIPAQLAEQVFEPFFTTKIRGTGLGLAISKRIVDDHGGEIRLEGAGQPGAKFLILLRRCLS